MWRGSWCRRSNQETLWLWTISHRIKVIPPWRSSPRSELKWSWRICCFARIADLLFISFTGPADGTLADGHTGLLQTTQKGLIATAGHANSNSRVALDGFPAEHINIRATGN